MFAGAALLLGFVTFSVPPDALALARVCVSEIGWDTTTDDCPAIARVLQRRGPGGIAAGARRYTPRIMGARPPLTTRQAWLTGLTAGGREPSGWPASAAPWARYRAAWLRWLAAAERILAGLAGPGPCATAPDHWGDRFGDLARARRLGYRPVHCGRTVNLFWRRP